MKALFFVAISLLILGATAIAQDVRYDYDRDKDFSKYHTYKWVTIQGSDQLDELTTKRIVNAIDAELATKAFTKASGDKADLYIAYQTAIGKEKQFTAYNSGWNYGPGWGSSWYRHGGGMSTSSTYGTTSTVYVGQLDVSMYDPATKQLIWRGEASKTLDPTIKPEKADKEIKKAVQKVLKNFPPKPRR